VLVIPAIDILGGQCVRLTRGDLRRKTIYHHDPGEVARRWTDEGAELIHVVDLDGAISGRLANEKAIRAIRRATEVPIEVGGGLRSVEDVERVLGIGARYAILGTAALRDRGVVSEAVRRFPGRIIVGIDARGGRVAVEGWTETSDVSAVDLAREMHALGVGRIIATDIATDGVLTGPNIGAMRGIAEAAGLEVIASGGVSSLADVRALAALEPLGVVGCIIGRALYVGAVSLPEAIKAGASRRTTE
jgi:phosphoribosylformimino-5-aminoimidazole carboxamide ribotide isomerase